MRTSTHKRKSHHFVALDLGSYSLKLIEVDMNNNNPEIKSSFTIPIPKEVDSSTPNSLGKWISDIWKEHNIKTKYISISLPRDQVLITEMDFPEGDEIETRQMIELRIERELPIPIDTVKSDYCVMKKGELGDRKIMVISTKNESIEFYKSIAREARLFLEGIELSVLSTNRAIQDINSSMDLYTGVNIGHSSIEFFIVEQGKIVFSRSANFGVKSLIQSLQSGDSSLDIDKLKEIDCSNSNNMEINAWTNKLTFELKRNLESYTMETGTSAPTQLVFCGGGSLLSGLNQTIQGKLGSTVQIIDLSRMFSNKLQVESSQASLFPNVYGLALVPQPSSQSCDFLNPRLFVKDTRKLPVRIRQIAIGFACIIVVVGILLGALYKKQRDLDKLQSEYAQYRSLVAQSEQLITNVSLLQSWKKEQISVIDILRDLSSIWSNDAYLQVLTYDRTKDITLTGLASSNQAVADLLTRINRSTVFTDTKFTYIRASKRNPTYPIEFGLSMKLKTKPVTTPLSTTAKGQ